VKKGGSYTEQEEKAKIVSELQGKFEKAKGVIFTDFQGLTLKRFYQLRKRVKSIRLEYKVVKNTLPGKRRGHIRKKCRGLFQGL